MLDRRTSQLREDRLSDRLSWEDANIAIDHLKVMVSAQGKQIEDLRRIITETKPAPRTPKAASFREIQNHMGDPEDVLTP